MSRTALLVFPLLALPFAGCGPSAAPAAPALPTRQSSAEWRQIDNPEYLNWKGFPVGTAVVRTSTTRTTAGDHPSTTSVERFTLIAVSGTGVTVERQNTTTRSDGSYSKVNEPERREVAARVPVHPELDPADLLKPDRKAKKAGRERVRVIDAEVECVRWEWSNGTEAGSMSVVSWLSDDVPGRIVRQEMRVPAIASVTVETVTEWVKK